MAAPSKLRRRAVLVLLSSVLSFAVGETAFRQLLVHRFKKANAAFEHELWRIEPGTRHLYGLHPGVQRDNRVGNEDDGWAWSYSIDGDGDRRVPGSPDPEAAETRVLVLGDSYTFGWGLDDQDTLPSLLQARLESSKTLGQAAVINGGVPGFNTMQEASYLASRWDRWRPDVVVLGFVMNDAEPPRVVPRDPRERYGLATLWLLEELRLRTGWTDGPIPTRVGRKREFTAQFQPGAPERQQCRAALESIATFCGEQGVPLLLFIYPGTAALPMNESMTYPHLFVHQTVASWGQELGLPTVDLWPHFEGELKAPWIVPGDGHPSRSALDIFAGEIEKALAEWPNLPIPGAR